MEMKTEADGIRLFKPKDVADRLGVHRETVMRMIRAGELPAIDVARSHGEGSSYRRWRVREADLVAWFEARREGGE